MRAVYTAKVTKCYQRTFLLIKDMGLGRTVTNDINNVLADQRDRLTPGTIVVYRDSDGIWGEVLINEQCQFVDFRRLNDCHVEDAILHAWRRHEAERR
jgi:hypothetical protein